MEVSLFVRISDGCGVPPTPGFLLLQSRCQPPPALSSLSEGESELTELGRTSAAVDVEESCAGWGELWLAGLISDDGRIVKWMASLVPKALWCKSPCHFNPNTLTFEQKSTSRRSQIWPWQFVPQRGYGREAKGEWGFMGM